MSVLSSTSSSSQRLPAHSFALPLAAATFVLLVCVCALEWRLASKGFEPTVADSEERWQSERLRAGRLGDKALILVGSSRMHLDVDLEILREETALEPVQLAIDGNSFFPILRGLARDPNVSGTVVVGFEDRGLALPGDDIIAVRYERNHGARALRSGLPDFSRSESQLTEFVRRRMRSYADGRQPVSALVMRAIPGHASAQYLVMLPDRSVLADFSLVDMPHFYFRRVQRVLNLAEMPTGDSPAEIEAALRAEVERLSPIGNEQYLRMIELVMADVQTIEGRGGEVLFLVMPTDKLFRLLEQRQFPRDRFYNRFAARAGERAHHFADIPSMAGFTCPDGSHLDRRNRGAFTHALIDELDLER